MIVELIIFTILTATATGFAICAIWPKRTRIQHHRCSHEAGSDIGTWNEETSQHHLGLASLWNHWRFIQH
jgi:hypothetical protein